MGAPWRPEAEAFSPAALPGAAFLSRHGERTREAYALDLQLWFGYCQRESIDPLAAQWQQIELFEAYLGGRQQRCEERAA